MALAPVPPLPPELAEAADGSYPSDADLDTLWDAAVELADDAALDPQDAVRDLAQSEGAPRWHVYDDRSAEWAMRHVAEADAQLAQLKAQRDEWVRHVEQWFRRAAGREQARRSFFADLLETYAIAERVRTGDKRKTVDLPSGKVRTSSGGPKVAVQEPAKVLAWAKGAGVLEQVAPPKHELKLTPLRDLVRAVEVIDWAQLVLADGTTLEWMRDGVDAVYASEASTPRTVVHGEEGETCPEVGDAPEAEWCTALVARVEVLASHTEVHGPNGERVPGTYVEPGGVTATVKAELG